MYQYRVTYGKTVWEYWDFNALVDAFGQASDFKKLPNGDIEIRHPIDRDRVVLATKIASKE